jgi:hypothetical protein
MAEPTAQETANTIWLKAQAIRQLADAGYDRVMVVEAVAAGDLRLLKPNRREGGTA